MTASRTLLPLLAALSGCSAQWKGGDTAAIGGDTESGDAADTSDSTGDSPAETGTLPTLYNWVLTSMPLSGRTAGFDFTGDGSPDNKLSDFTSFIDTAITADLAAAGPVEIFQFAGVEPAADPTSWDDDAVALALLTATDADGDPTDNASGVESFTAEGALDETGAALDNQSVSVVSGGYTATFTLAQLRAGSLTLDLATPLHVAAYADPDTNGGTLGFALSLEAAAALAIEGGAAANVIESIGRSADIDLNGDGERDAISAAFQFTAVACQVE